MPTIKGKERPPRLTVEITEAQYNKLKEHLPHGMLKQVFAVVIDDMLEMYKAHGDHFTIALLQHRISYRPLMDKYTERQN